MINIKHQYYFKLSWIISGIEIEPNNTKYKILLSAKSVTLISFSNIYSLTACWEVNFAKDFNLAPVAITVCVL